MNFVMQILIKDTERSYDFSVSGSSDFSEIIIIIFFCPFTGYIHIPCSTVYRNYHLVPSVSQDLFKCHELPIQDPDQGSVLLDPGIQDRFFSGSQISDPQPIFLRAQ
jgi:hypothetical protein